MHRLTKNGCEFHPRHPPGLVTPDPVFSLTPHFHCNLLSGGYVVTQAFVPSVSGPVSSDGVAHLRGAAANRSQGFGTLGYGLGAAATTLAAMTTGRGRVARKAEGGSSFDPSTQLGAMAPLGYFDPLGFCKKGDEATFRNLRASEIKHGRVATGR